jgi:hypothetical protein
VIAELLDSLKRASGLRWPRRRCQVAKEAATTRAYGATRGVGAVEAGTGRVKSGHVMSYLASTCLVARSFTNKPNRSNSKEQELSVVEQRIERRLDKVRSYQHIVEVKWSEKHRVAY